LNNITSFWVNVSFQVSATDNIAPCWVLPNYIFEEVHFQWNANATIWITVDNSSANIISNTSRSGENWITHDQITLTNYKVCVVPVVVNQAVYGNVSILVYAWTFDLTGYNKKCLSPCTLPAPNNSVFVIDSPVPQMVLLKYYGAKSANYASAFAAPFAFILAAILMAWAGASCACSSARKMKPFFYKKDPKKIILAETSLNHKLKRDIFYATKVWPYKLWNPKTHLTYPIEKQKQIMAFLIIVRRKNHFLHLPIVHLICSYIAQSDDYLTILHLRDKAFDLLPYNQV